MENNGKNKPNYYIWLKTEYKRAVLMLPLILKRAVILAAVCLAAGGIIAFCACVIQNGGNAEPKLRIGYAAGGGMDNMLTEFAVSYVQDMESVQSLCSLEEVAEQEGKKLLAEGALSALIVLPDDVINEILSGKNTPAKLYLPAKKDKAVQGGGLDAVGGMLFEELVSAGMGMLGTAQAQIYASSSVLQQLSEEYGGNAAAVDGSLLQSMYDDINRFNLGVVTAREDLFQTKKLSLTGNDTYAVYYGSAALTVYVMLAGLFFGAFCKRSGFWQKMADRRLGVGYAAQLFDRCLAGSLLMLAVTLFPFLLSAMPQVRALLSIKITFLGTVILMLITVFASVYHMMVYQLVERRESAVVAAGIFALIQAYMSGCLIPSVFLPKAVTGIGRLLPAAFIKKGFTAFLTGEAEGFLDIAAGLAVWELALFLVTLVSMQTDAERASAHAERSLAGKTKRLPPRMHVPSVAAVLFRRLLHKKSIWLCLAFFAVASVGIIQAEKSSETQIKAAVYDESGDYKELLENYDGLVSFEIYGDGEQVMDAVRRGNAECGYVLPRKLAEDMTARRANQSVIVYQDADAVAVPVVNEVIFERIFRQVSLAWYADYIAQSDAVREFGAERTALEEKAKSCFEKELSEGTTFRFEIERVGTDDGLDGKADKKETTYPIYFAAATAVLLCALQGAVQAAADIRNKSFYKRNRAAMSLLTIILPVLLGVLFSVVVLVVLVVL